MKRSTWQGKGNAAKLPEHFSQSPNDWASWLFLTYLVSDYLAHTLKPCMCNQIKAESTRLFDILEMLHTWSLRNHTKLDFLLHLLSFIVQTLANYKHHLLGYKKMGSRSFETCSTELYLVYCDSIFCFKTKCFFLRCYAPTLYTN